MLKNYEQRRNFDSKIFENVEKVKTLDVEFARKNGSDIYILRNPIEGFDEDYVDYRKETLQRFYRKPLWEAVKKNLSP